MAARDFDRAAHLMELAVPAIRRDRQEAMLLGWLQALPDDAVRRSPVLSVFYGYMLMVSGDLAAVEARLDDAERALAAVPDGETPPWADTEELQTLPATIAIYRASLAQARGDVAGTAEHARRALDLAGPNDHLARGGALGFLGLAAWAKGDVSGALETFTQAVASLHAAGNLVDELSSTVLLADMWLAAGRPGKARRLYQGALRLAEAHGGGVARATADLHVGVSEIDLRDRGHRERQPRTAEGRGARRAGVDERGPIPVVPGHGSSRRRRGRPAERPSRCWTRHSSSTDLGSSRAFVRFRRSRPGSGSRRATCRRPQTGPRTEACPRLTMPAI